MEYCLGTVQFGLDYGIQGNHQPRQEAVNEMLIYALENGITCFDTASEYGNAEAVLGSFICKNEEQHPRMEVISKLKPNAFENHDESEWPSIAETQAKKSLEKLNISSFAAYLFHHASAIYNPKAVEALCRVKELGLAEKIGVSIYTPQEALQALEYPQISVVQIPYNVFDHRLDRCDFFEKAKNRGVRIFARSSLLQGLAVMDPDVLPEKVGFSRPYLKKFMDICHRYSVLPLHAAVGYVAAKKDIDYIVFGVDNLAQLKEYAVLQSKTLPEGMVNDLEAAFGNVEERLVNPVLWK